MARLACAVVQKVDDESNVVAGTLRDLLQPVLGTLLEVEVGLARADGRPFCLVRVDAVGHRHLVTVRPARRARPQG